MIEATLTMEDAAISFVQQLDVVDEESILKMQDMVSA